MDPANAKFVCGAECGIAATGTASAGTEHWSTASAGITVVTSGPSSMRSTRAFRFNPSAATQILTHTFAAAIGSPATMVGRLYVYFATLPTGAGNTYTLASVNAGNQGVYYDVDTGTIRVFAFTVNGASGVSITSGQWYRVDFKFVRNATWTSDAQVDGSAVPQATSVQSAGTYADVMFGTNASKTVDVYFDDIIVSGTSGDYPIGDGTVVGLYPNGDRTNTAAAGSDGTPNGTYHFYSATTDFGKGASGATATGAQNAEATSWQSLANPLSTSIATNWIADLLGASTEYMVWRLGPTLAVAQLNGVMHVVATHSASATTNDFQSRVIDGINGGILMTQIQADLSESTITVPISAAGVASGGANLTACLNAGLVCVSFGHSTDVNPDPYLDGVCLEVDYVQAAGQPPYVNPMPQLLAH